VSHELTRNQFEIVDKVLDQHERERLHNSAWIQHAAVGSVLSESFGDKSGNFKRFLDRLIDPIPQNRVPSEQEIAAMGVKTKTGATGMQDWVPMEDDN